MGPDAAYEEGVGRIPPQGGPQADGTEAAEGTGHRLGLTLYGGCDVGGRIIGVGDLSISSPEHSSAIYCN